MKFLHVFSIASCECLVCFFFIFQIGSEVLYKSTLRAELFPHSRQHGDEYNLCLALLLLSLLNTFFGLQFILSYLKQTFKISQALLWRLILTPTEAKVKNCIDLSKFWISHTIHCQKLLSFCTGLQLLCYHLNNINVEIFCKEVAESVEGLVGVSL